jgi:hypothetical protein
VSFSPVVVPIVAHTVDLTPHSIDVVNRVSVGCKKLVLFHHAKVTIRSAELLHQMVDEALTWKQNVDILIVFVPAPYNGNEDDPIVKMFLLDLNNDKQRVSVQFRAAFTPKAEINRARKIPSISQFVPSTIGQDVFGLARLIDSFGFIYDTAICSTPEGKKLSEVSDILLEAVTIMVGQDVEAVKSAIIEQVAYSES